MAPSLDARRVRDSTPPEMRDYYREYMKQDSVENITEQLLNAIDIGLLPPRSFQIWLGVTKSPIAILRALQQDMSTSIRTFGLSQFVRSMCTAKWRGIWDALGGTSGILGILSSLSVMDVRRACRWLGACAKSKTDEHEESSDLLEKRACITELFQGLHSDVFPEARYKTEDERPLSKAYRYLIPSCSSDLVKRIVAGEFLIIEWPGIEDLLMQYHPDIMRKGLLDSDEGLQNIGQKKLLQLISKYPITRTSQPGFSASMDFALQVLHILIQEDTKKVDDAFFKTKLVLPLLKRAIRKGVKYEVIRDAVDLMMRYFETYPLAGKEMNNNVGDIRHMVAQCWSRRSDLFEIQLKKLCHDEVYGTTKIDRLDAWQNFLERIPKSRRYALLRLVMQESTGLDIYQSSDLAKVKGCLTHDMLENIGNENGLLLFTRLRKVRGDDGLLALGSWHTNINLSSAPEGSDGDADMCYILLLRQNGQHSEAEQLARAHIETRKKKAMFAAQAEYRAHYARSALFTAIASGSMSLFESALDWSKRFVKDPLVLKDSLYIFPATATRFFSGIPQPLNDTVIISELRNRINAANSILMSMFEIVCLALREPSFNIHVWQNMINTFCFVVQERMTISPQLRDLMKISEDDLFSILWKDVIPMLISIEEKGNQEGYERLELNTVRGILSRALGEEVSLKPKTSSTVVFFDKYAQARDELWQSLRLKAHPAVVELPSPYPRGLALQHLTGSWMLDVNRLDQFAPYLSSRIQSALFVEPTAALQPIDIYEEVKKAIGPFIDSFQIALKMYAPPSCEGRERKRRLRKVWDYAIGPLSKERMDTQEAYRFWAGRKLSDSDLWPPRDELEKDKLWPIIPHVDEPSRPTEWNPFTSQPENIEKRLRKTTYIDLSTDGEETHWDAKLNFVFNIREQLVNHQSYDKRHFWNRNEQRPNEASKLAAMLYLDTKFRADTRRILDDPFPAEQVKNCRYPSLFLDDEFLMDNCLDEFSALLYVTDSTASMPPALLSQLAENIVSALEITDSQHRSYTQLQRAACKLVKSLGQSDRPALAGSLAVRVILNHPDATSWHRQMLSLKYLRTLSSFDTKIIFQHFADHIIQRLASTHKAFSLPSKSANAAVTSTLDVIQSKASSQSLVKVSTIKLLAALLNDTEFVSQKHAVSLLSQLFQKAKHIDARLAVVKSLLGMLNACAPKQTHVILTALEPIILIAGTLSERESFNEGDWYTINVPRTLPEGPTSHDDSSSPILGLLIRFYRQGLSSPTKVQAFLQTIILPILERLREQTSAWASLFLEEIQPVLKAKQEIEWLPPIPRDISLIRDVLLTIPNGVVLVPRTFVEEYVEYVLFMLSPPTQVKELNGELRAQPVLSSRPHVKTWLRLYGQNASDFSTFDIFSLLAWETKLPTDVGITPQLIQEKALEVFNNFVHSDTPVYIHLTHWVEINMHEDRLVQPWWHAHAKPIVRAMIAYIDSLRTKEWIADPDRKPVLLPDTLTMRTRLLDYPFPNQEDTNETREARCQHFATEITTLVMEYVDTVGTEWLDTLKSYLKADPTGVASYRRAQNQPIVVRSIWDRSIDALQEQLYHNRLVTATYLGNLGFDEASKNPQTGYLMIELACHLMDLSGQMDSVENALHKRLVDMLQKWKLCPLENVRRKGFILSAKYFQER